MADAVQLILSFFTEILVLMPDTPFFYLFALAIVLIIVNNLFYWLKGGK